MTPWKHQTEAIEKVTAAIDAGERRLCLRIATGGGKTLVAAELIRWARARGWPVSLYTNRRALIDQLSESLTEFGITHGIRCEGYEEANWAPVQLHSTQTEHKRGESEHWDLHPAKLILIDEAHIQTGDMIQSICAKHLDLDAALVGLTATPYGMAVMYNQIIECGTMAELRACGALVLAHHYGPDEPDLRALKKGPGSKNVPKDPEDLDTITEPQAVKLMKPAKLIGRVSEWYAKLNPDRRPAILFAPDVAGSLWYAQRFTADGIPAVHIDGKDCWVNGGLYPTTTELREQIRDWSESGRIAIVCNRFVMREGINWPWLAHGIFATVFGTVQTYLQSGGRLLRSYPGKEICTIQDHGGNWWRHGSLNADREWHLDYDARMAYGCRAERLRSGQDPTPSRCPRCAGIIGGRRCHGCGFEYAPKQKAARAVVTEDGTLVEMDGTVFKPRQLYQSPNGPALWTRYYWRARSEKWNATFAQARALFAQENFWKWPRPDWPLMPRSVPDLFRKVRDVPLERLTSNPGVTV